MTVQKILAALAVSALMTGAAAVAHAESAPAAAPAVEKGAPEGDKGGNFDERKAKLLDNLKKKVSCVEAAKDKEALKGCFPHRGRFGGKMGKEGAKPE